jgi:hypothetical protein
LRWRKASGLHDRVHTHRTIVSLLLCVIGCSGRSSTTVDDSDAGLTKPTATPAGIAKLAIEIPNAAGGAIRLSTRGLSLGVELVDARPARIEKTPTGVEDWVEYATAPAIPEASYRLSLGGEVGGLRHVGDELEIVDHAGVPRLRMTRPFLVDRDGVRHAATTSVEGCAVDRDPSPPWGRAPVAPGASECTLRIAWNAAIPAPFVLDPAWSTTASWGYSRRGHVAVTLKDGRILIVGGEAAVPSFTATEIFDPATETWAVTGNMNSMHSTPAATLLDDGRVFVTGQTGSSPAAEFWSPTSGTWTLTPPPSNSRFCPTVTKLPDGRVLVFGGHDSYSVSGDVLATAQIWVPTTNTWATAPSAPTPRQNHTATLLADGRVLVIGGKQYIDTVDSYVFFDPTGGGSWSSEKSIPGPRVDHTSTLLPDGRVLVVGGYKVFGAGAGLLDPATGTWTDTTKMPDISYDHAATLLPDGDVLITGGWVDPSASRSARVFSPTANLAWSTLPDMALSRSNHTATLLPPSASAPNTMRVLVAGGYTQVQILTGTKRTTACTSDSQCMTGHCQDGVCCDTACGLCLACTAAKRGKGSDGECGTIPVDKDPDNDCPAKDPTTCGTVGACDGAGACTLFPAGTACAKPQCVLQPSGRYSHDHPECDGKGKCEFETEVCSFDEPCFETTGCGIPPTPDAGTPEAGPPPPPVDQGSCLDDTTAVSSGGTVIDCTPYRCSDGACASPCYYENSCADGYTCQNNKCVQPSTGSSGGCSTSPVHSSNAAVVLLAALTAYAMRRRSVQR